MNGFTKENETRLIGLLDRENELFRRIDELTKEQAKQLEEDDIEAFDKSLDRGQELIEQINGLHQESDSLMQSYISYRDSAGGMEITAINEAAARLSSVIESCVALNDKNTITAKEKAEGYTGQIGKLSLNRKGIGAYIQGVPNTSELFDKRT